MTYSMPHRMMARRRGNKCGGRVFMLSQGSQVATAIRQSRSLVKTFFTNRSYKSKRIIKVTWTAKWTTSCAFLTYTRKTCTKQRTNFSTRNFHLLRSQMVSWISARWREPNQTLRRDRCRRPSKYPWTSSRRKKSCSTGKCRTSKTCGKRLLR